MIFLGNYTALQNGQWVTIDFPDRDLTKLTWMITATRGSIDIGDPTQVVINDIELFSSNIPIVINQEPCPYFEEIPRWWNGLDWAFSLHIDDVTDNNQVPLSWLNLQPLTLMMMGGNPSCSDSYVTAYHVEYGSHGIWNSPDGENWNYFTWYSNLIDSRNIIESATLRTSIWSTKCISFAHPWSRANPYGQRALWDTGFRAGGQCYPIDAPVQNTCWRVRNPQNQSIYNDTPPRCDQDWLFTFRQGGKPQTGSIWDVSYLIATRENNSFADMMLHYNEGMINSYKSFVQNDTTGWHSTWSEVTSYSWFRKYINVTMNYAASDLSKIVFDIDIHNYDARIWEVPITFKFNLTDFKWNGKIDVKWINNGTIYKNSFDNISIFSSGSGQHVNQTMREGYRWDGNILYLSIKPGNQSSSKSIYLYKNVKNSPPTASFTYTPFYPTNLDVIQFIDQSYDIDGIIVNWSWNFGDGDTSYLQNPTHKYNNYGYYTVNLTVTDDDGANDSIQKNIVCLSIPNIVYVDDDYDSLTHGWQIDHFDKIQDGIDGVAENGTVYVYNGIYYESIKIDYPLNLIGQDKYNTIIDGGSLGTVVKINSDSVSLSNFTVKKSGHASSYTAGILIESDNISLKNNNIFDNCIGIQITDAENCLIQGNTINNNYLPGIRLLTSTNNTILDNTITSNGLDAIEYATVPGVILESSFNNSLLDNEISNNAEGISLLSSNMNVISNNVVLNNLKNGIYFEKSSNNSIQDNKVTGNYESGLKLNRSHNNSFYNNLIDDNGCEGIWLFFSYYNDFFENVVSGNNRGFELGGYKNKIRNNLIKNNTEFGIHFWATCANKIYRNNFINNKYDASFSHIFLIGHSKINELFWINNNLLDQNYWGKSRLLPKLIFGYVKIFSYFENKELFRLPWLDIDWRPAKEPYDIQVPEV